MGGVLKREGGALSQSFRGADKKLRRGGLSVFKRKFGGGEAAMENKEEET